MAAIGFIGLGNMGRPMARNLAAAGHDVRGHDTDAGARAAAGEAGLAVADGLAAAVGGADAVVTMLPAGADVRAAYAGGGGVLAHAAPGALLVDCSTIDVETARDLHREAAGRGFAHLDAPVSGGVGGAAAGTLTFMAGGGEAAFDRARPLFDAMGRNVFLAGGPGCGQAAKMCNNMVLGVSMIAVSEAFVLAERVGIDARILFDVMSAASGQCWALTSYCPVPGPVPSSPANRGYEAGFTAAMMSKDLGLARAAAETAGAAAPLGAHAAELFARYCAEGGGAGDFSGIVRMLRADAARRAGDGGRTGTAGPVSGTSASGR